MNVSHYAFWFYDAARNCEKHVSPFIYGVRDLSKNILSTDPSRQIDVYPRQKYLETSKLV